jgi:2-polyprenyl-3-methyl-5-hydroxy-6-metoxy-1,4-benzoquinol methylase
MAVDWNAGLYDASHAFVWEFGRDLLALLALRAGERILHIGRGTGPLTAEIAAEGARVTGVDRSMIALAGRISGARVRRAGRLHAGV